MQPRSDAADDDYDDDYDDDVDRATVAARGVRAAGGPDAAAEPLYQTSAFHFDTVEASEPALALESGYAYARYGLPNARSLELTLAALEGAEDALATSSGTSAVLCAVLACARAGDRVVFQQDAYGGTTTLLREDLARLGIDAVPVDAQDVAAVERALGGGAAALLVEVLSNPLLREAPVADLARVCAARGVPLLVDSTFATPILRRPLGEGADAVIHSATKLLGGHHDLCAGVVAGGRDLVGRARGVSRRLGTQAAPLDAWLCSRGLRTLALRVERAQDNARALAERLAAHPAVRRVHHPGWGTLVSFDVGAREDASRVVRGLRGIRLVPSLGGTATSVSHPATSSHRGLAAEERRALGIGDGLLRLSVGVEAVGDLWRELAAALDC